MIAAIICFFVVLCVGWWLFAVVVENAGAFFLLLLVFVGVVILAQVMPDHAPANTPPHTPPPVQYTPEVLDAMVTYGVEPVRLCAETTEKHDGTSQDFRTCVQALPPRPVGHGGDFPPIVLLTIGAGGVGALIGCGVWAGRRQRRFPRPRHF